MVSFPTVRFRGVELTTHAGISYAGTVGEYRVLVQHELAELTDGGAQVLLDVVHGHVDCPDGVRIVARGPTLQRVADGLDEILTRFERESVALRAAEYANGPSSRPASGDVLDG